MKKTIMLMLSILLVLPLASADWRENFSYLDTGDVAFNNNSPSIGDTVESGGWSVDWGSATGWHQYNESFYYGGGCGNVTPYEGDMMLRIGSEGSGSDTGYMADYSGSAFSGCIEGAYYDDNSGNPTPFFAFCMRQDDACTGTNCFKNCLGLRSATSATNYLLREDGAYVDSGVARTTCSWVVFRMCSNSSLNMFYINNESIRNDTSPSYKNLDGFWLKAGDAGTPGVGLWDAMYVWECPNDQIPCDRPATTDASPPPPVNDSNTINISLVLPYDGDHDNTFSGVDFIAQINSSETSNCTLYYGGFNMGENTGIAAGVTNTSWTVVWTPPKDETKTWAVHCNNTQAGENSSEWTFTMDTINPLPDIVNISGVHNRSEKNLTLTAWVSDTNVFGSNYSLIAPNGSTVYNNTALNLTGSYYGFNYTLNLTGLDVGVYTIVYNTSDDHTAKDWKPKNTFKGYNSLKVDKVTVRAEGTGVQDIITTKKKDRIEYEFKKAEKDKNKKTSYYVECDEPIYYRKTSDYIGHFVCGEQWIDFESEKREHPTITQIDAYTYLVSMKESKFNSMGGLNFASITQTFTLQDSPMIDVNAYDYNNNQLINSFTAMIWNGSYSETKTSTNGFVTMTPPSNGSYFLQINATDYLPINGTATANYSGYASLKPHQTEVIITGYIESNLTTFTTQINGSTNTTTNGTIRYYLRSGNHSATFNTTNYFTAGHVFDLQPQDISAYDFSFHNHNFSISAHNISDNKSVQTFTAYIYKTDGTLYQSKNVSSYIGYFNVTDGAYNITVIADNFAPSRANVTFDALNSSSLNVSMFPPNSFNLIFEDAINRTILTGYNISLEIFSDVMSENYSTTSGAILLENIPSGNYSFRYSAPAYPERYTYYELSTNESINDTVYLLRNDSATTVSIIVYDQNNQELEDAIIKALRYNILTNNYDLVDSQKTNFEGTAYLDLELYTELYKFICLYDGNVLKVTKPTHLYNDELTLKVSTVESVLTRYEDQIGVYHSLTFSNSSDSFVYIYTDNNGAITRGCLNVIRETGSADVLINTTCVTGSAGEINISVARINDTTYRAEAYVYDSVGKIHLETKKHTFGTGAAKFGLLGVFVSVLLVITIMFVGAWNLAVATLLVPAGLWFMKITQLLAVGSVPLTLISLVAIIIAYIISDKA